MATITVTVPRTKAAKDAPDTLTLVNASWSFEVTPEQERECAKRYLVIMAQARYRASVAKDQKDGKRPDPKPWAKRTFDVKEMLKSSRDPAARVGRAKKALESLSDDERKALLAEIAKGGKK